MKTLWLYHFICKDLACLLSHNEKLNIPVATFQESYMKIKIPYIIQNMEITHFIQIWKPPLLFYFFQNSWILKMRIGNLSKCYCISLLCDCIGQYSFNIWVCLQHILLFSYAESVQNFCVYQEADYKCEEMSEIKVHFEIPCFQYLVNCNV